MMNADWLVLLLGVAGVAGAFLSRKLPISGKLALGLVGVVAAGVGLSQAFC
jgi:hypothetical protein